MPAPLYHPIAPYRGLEPYRFSDRSIFFERTTETRDLLRLIIVCRAVLLYGESGAGKSSLVNAGLFPLIIEEGLVPLRIRIGSGPDAELIVERIKKGDFPAEGYIDSPIFPELNEDLAHIVSCAELEDRICNRDDPSTPLLVFDQFEEFITLAEETTDTHSHSRIKKARENILNLIANLINNQGLRIKLLFVFREEYLAKFSELFSCCPRLLENYLRLLAPPESSLEKIISGPFNIEGLPIIKNPFDATLTEKVVELFHKRFERGILNLSEIQVVCLRLWKSNPESRCALLDTHGIGGLIGDFISEALEGIESKKRDAAIRYAAISILTKMITRSGTRNIVSSDHIFSMIHSEETVLQADLESALNHLVVQLKLVRKESRKGAFFYEIVSEFIIPWIKTQAERRAIRLQRKRWIRRIAVIVVLSIIALVFCGIIIWHQRTDTYREAAQNKLVRVAQSQLSDTSGQLSAAQKTMSRIKATERQMESDKNTLIMEENNLKSALDEKSNDLEKSRHLISDLSATVLNAQNENHRSAGEIVRLQSTVNDLTTQYNELQTRIAELSKPSSPIPARSVENRDSTMIVYTVGSLNRRSKKRPEIFVDEYPYAFIVPFTYVTLTFPHGLHTVCIADYFDPCETVEVYLVPKSTAYVRVDITDDGPRRFRPSLQGADTGHSESHALNPISNDKIINHSAD